MINKNLTLKFLYGINHDLFVFEGHWKGQWFQAIYFFNEYEIGWDRMTVLRQFSNDDEGVFNSENQEFDDIQDALTDVDVSIDYKVEIE